MCLKPNTVKSDAVFKENPYSLQGPLASVPAWIFPKGQQGFHNPKVRHQRTVANKDHKAIIMEN